MLSDLVTSDRPAKVPSTSCRLCSASPALLEYQGLPTVSLSPLPLPFLLNRYKGLFMAYAYQCYTYSKTTLDKLFDWNPRLRRLYKQTAWAACTVNFGPFTVTFPHVDAANLCFGWCAITALGNFNPASGGHLILWDLGLYIRFPPGSTILLPSALLVHSNAPISVGEERFSIIQYSSAGLFRWVENGFRSDANFDLHADAYELQRRNVQRRDRWNSGLCMFTNWADIQAGNWKGVDLDY